MTIPDQTSKANGLLLAAFFVLSGVLLLILVSVVTRYGVIATAYNPAYLRIPGRVETLITGASDMQFGVDPELIEGAINIARPAENLFYSYYKLKFLLNSNHTLKTVILGYGPHALSQNREHDLYRTQFHNLYFMLLDNSAVKIIRRPTRDFYYFITKYRLGIPLEIQQELSLLIRILFNTVSIYDYPFSENYVGHEGSRKLNIDMYHANAFLGDDHALAPYSDLMAEYLKKIVLLCKDRNVKLVLLGAPQHPALQAMTPPAYESHSAYVLDRLREINPNIQFYDYRTFKLDPGCFFDAAHLNSTGSRLFSQEINKVLQKNIADVQRARQTSP